MNYKDIKPGKYKAFAVDAGSGLSAEKQTPYVTVEFRIPELEDVHIRWTGYLTEKTTDRSLDVLALLDWDAKDKKLNAETINLEREVLLVVKHEANQKTGEMEPRVQWVNDPNASFGLEADITAFNGFDLRAEMEAAKKRLGAKRPAGGGTKGIDKNEQIPW